VTPATIIDAATADGVGITLSTNGTLKVAGDCKAVNRWLPTLRQHKAEILEAIRNPDLHGFTLAELEAEANPDEWREVKDNPAALEAFALALREAHQVKQGIVPERWTGRATCAHCGPVVVPPFMNGLSLISCRWCRRRAARESSIRSVPTDEPW
jgi:hypothetical protein